MQFWVMANDRLKTKSVMTLGWDLIEHQRKRLMIMLRVMVSV